MKVKLMQKENKSYDIEVERGQSKKLVSYLKKLNASKIIIVTDEKVKSIYGNKLVKQLKNKKIDSNIISFSSGEKSKNLKTVLSLSEKLLSLGADRKSALLALGGGVVGDITGFLASVYMRGVDFVQVPTTLVAMVDSSIGGKTGVDLNQGKNSVGSFYQPKKVFIDVNYLKSLSEKELREGLAEAVKTGVIGNKKLFELLEKKKEKILKKDLKVLEKIVKESVKVKAKVVEKDEKEKNLRKILNYGHTIGHGIESLGKYKKYTHGEAVSFGMMIEGKLANEAGYLSDKSLERQNKLIKALCCNLKKPGYKIGQLISVMKKDKKSSKGKIQFSLPSGIGKMKTVKGLYGIEVSEKIIRNVWKEFK